MDKFNRPIEPEYLKKARAELCKGDYVPKAVWDTFRSRKDYELLREYLKNASAETCTFCAGIFADTIEHFEPKAGKYSASEKVLAWDNLFPACRVCQAAKGAKFSSDLLKPDTTTYTPQTYFVINAADGSLEPSPAATEAQKLQAKTTIDMYDLDSSDLKKDRRMALKVFYSHDVNGLEKYRFIAELLA
jgi:uncharacterized protein (TIGR02646 family)